MSRSREDRLIAEQARRYEEAMGRENLAIIGASEHARLHGHSWRTSRWSDRTCKGCGCDHDSMTEGCAVCRTRMRLRRYREAQRAA